MQKQYGGDQFEIISVVLGDTGEPAIQKFMGDLKPNFPIVKLADEDEVAEAYDIRFVPVNVLVGPDGVIRARPQPSRSQEDWDREILPHIPGAAQAQPG